MVIGGVCSFVAVYYLFMTIEGTVAFVCKDFDYRERGMLGFLLVVGYLIVLIFGGTAYLCWKSIRK